MGVAFFLKMFPKKAPIDLLLKHTEILENLSKKIIPLVDDYIDGKDISHQVEEISDLESMADHYKFDLRKLLSKNIKTPFAIRDLLTYLSKQEKIIDYIEDIAKKLSLNQITGLDAEIIKDFKTLVNEVTTAIDSLLVMINEIHKVMDSSFAEKYIKKEKKDRIKIEDIEGRVDKISLKIGKWIYSKKNDLNPIDLVFFRELVLIFVKISDITENTAEQLQSILK